MKRFLVCFLLAFTTTSWAGPVAPQDEKRIWPINEKTHEIPTHVDARTGFIDPATERIIDAANDSYDPDERLQIIDFCRHQAFLKRVGRLERSVVTKRLKDPGDGLRNELEEEFQYCAVGMIRSWEANDGRQ